MELEELYLQEEATVQGGDGQAMLTAIKAGTEKKQAEEMKRKLMHEIAELKVQNEKVIRDSVEVETRVRSLVIQNEEHVKLIKTNNFSKVCDKIVKIEVMVPQIVERIFEVDRFIEKVDIDAKLELSKREKKEIERQVKATVNLEI